MGKRLLLDTRDRTAEGYGRSALVVGNPGRAIEMPGELLADARDATLRRRAGSARRKSVMSATG